MNWSIIAGGMLAASGLVILVYFRGQATVQSPEVANALVNLAGILLMVGVLVVGLWILKRAAHGKSGEQVTL